MPMFTKFKAVLVLLAFIYVGYMGWKNFKGEPVRKPSFLKIHNTETNASELENPKENADTDHEKLTPLQSIQRELNQVESRLFAELTPGEPPQTAVLKTLWNRSEYEFKSGTITEQEARALILKITQLNRVSTERVLFVKRLEELENIKPSSLDKGLDVEEKRAFAEGQLKRQWAEWVSLNR